MSEGVKGVNVAEIPSSGIGNARAEEYARYQFFADNSTVLLFATRGMVPFQTWRAHDRLMWPMNQKRVKLDAVGMEVGEAYEWLIDTTLQHPYCEGWPWILVSEEDNLPEPDAYFKLIEAIRHCPDCNEPLGNSEECSKGHKAYDGVSGLYWTKTDPPMPMAFGDPAKHRDFSTQDVYSKMHEENPLDQRLEVNAIPMGFTLYRRSLFEKISKPRFMTADPDLDYAGENRGAIGQDIWLCIKAKAEADARFAVHCGCKVGHLDIKTGRCF